MSVSSKAIGALMNDDFQLHAPKWQSKVPWSTVMRKAQKTAGEFNGEFDPTTIAPHLRGSADIRMVYFENGTVRWIDSSKMESLGLSCKNHDGMYCKGDAARPTKEGYLMVTSEGEVRVRRTDKVPKSRVVRGRVVKKTAKVHRWVTVPPQTNPPSKP